MLKSNINIKEHNLSFIIYHDCNDPVKLEEFTDKFFSKKVAKDFKNTVKLQKELCTFLSNKLNKQFKLNNDDNKS